MSAISWIIKAQVQTHPDDMLRAGLRSEHAENSSSTTDVQDVLPLEKMWVVDDRRAVGARPDGVL